MAVDSPKYKGHMGCTPPLCVFPSDGSSTVSVVVETKYAGRFRQRGPLPLPRNGFLGQRRVDEAAEEHQEKKTPSGPYPDNLCCLRCPISTVRIGLPVVISLLDLQRPSSESRTSPGPFGSWPRYAPGSWCSCVSPKNESRAVPLSGRPKYRFRAVWVLANSGFQATWRLGYGPFLAAEVKIRFLAFNYPLSMLEVSVFFPPHHHAFTPNVNGLFP